MNVSLTPKLEAFVRRKVASGLYNNASEVVRESLRLLIERDDASLAARPSEPPRLEEVSAALAALERPLRAKGVRSLAVFGSLARGEAHADSDIDILIDVEPNAGFSLVSLAGVSDFLQDRLGRTVDVVTRAGIEPSLRERVFAEAEQIF